MNLTRRRFLTMTATAAVLPAASPGFAGPEAHWRGVALGAPASLRLVGLTVSEARPIFDQVEKELSRLENIFSLYRPNSSISILNRNGRLKSPPSELLVVLSLCDLLHRASEGAFDPTVQPLLGLFAQSAIEGRTPTTKEVARARDLIGWEAVSFGPGEMAFHRIGAALTLNGIAQGYITDRIAERLKSHGLSNVLIDMGEIRAHGHGPDRSGWRAGIQGTSGQVVERLTLSEQALATSAPLGTMLGAMGHIVDPTSGNTSNALKAISVVAREASFADGLSTALSVMPPSKHKRFMDNFPTATAIHHS